jgi:hypothetical protein
MLFLIFIFCQGWIFRKKQSQKTHVCFFWSLKIWVHLGHLSIRFKILFYTSRPTHNHDIHAFLCFWKYYNAHLTIVYNKRKRLLHVVPEWIPTLIFNFCVGRCGMTKTSQTWTKFKAIRAISTAWVGFGSGTPDATMSSKKKSTIIQYTTKDTL